MTKFDETKFANQNQVTVSALDVERIFEANPYYANKFFVTIQPDGMVRIAFADVDSNNTNMNVRTAVIMSFSAFASFANLVSENINNLAKLQQAAASMQMQVTPKVK